MKRAAPTSATRRDLHHLMDEPRELAPRSRRSARALDHLAGHGRGEVTGQLAAYESPTRSRSTRSSFLGRVRRLAVIEISKARMGDTGGREAARGARSRTSSRAVRVRRVFMDFITECAAAARRQVGDDAPWPQSDDEAAPSDAIERAARWRRGDAACAGAQRARRPRGEATTSGGGRAVAPPLPPRC